MTKKIAFLFSIIFSIVLIFSINSCQEKKMPKAYIATSKGQINCTLRPDAAPKHTDNFIDLAKKDYYKSTIFHLVEKNLVQGGDPSGNGQGGPGYTIKSEIGLKHKSGALAAARLPDTVNPERNSNGSQFFIVKKDLEMLDGFYTVFGYCDYETMDIVDLIEKGDTIIDIYIEDN